LVNDGGGFVLGRFRAKKQLNRAEGAAEYETGALGAPAED
jgi:hypothetical protein